MKSPRPGSLYNKTVLSLFTQHNGEVKTIFVTTRLELDQ